MSHIIGFIMRAAGRHATARFYQILGLTTDEHEHGGPLHYEVGPIGEKLVLEVYKSSPSFPSDAVMICVDSLEHATRAVSLLGIQPRTEIREVMGMRFVYVRDPDGRDVMLIEKKE
jgi:hypothetical protein